MFNSWIRLGLVAALSGVGAARATCTSLTESEVRTIAQQSADALLSDDTTTHRRGWRDFQEGFPCLKSQLPKEAWASLLVSEAIVRNALGEDWLQPLDTAVGAWPDVPGIPSFLRDEYAPAQPNLPIPHRVVRAGATLFVDGILVAVPPRVTGLHAVQLLENGVWTNRLLLDQPIPSEWLTSDEVIPEVIAPLAGRGSLSVLVGLGTVSQSVSEPGTYFGDTAQTGALAGVTLIGCEPIPSLGGLSLGWDIRGAAQLASINTAPDRSRTFSADPLAVPDLYGSVGWMGRGFAVLGGAGVSRSWVTTASALTPYFYPQPHAAIEIFGKRADFGFSGGATPSAGHLRMHAGSAVTSRDGIGLRFGADMSGLVAWFDELPPGTRKATVVSFGLGGTVGVVWGLAD